ncbi:MAG: PEGA domain-containing protein, partial [Alkalispirochaeta sp.]
PEPEPEPEPIEANLEVSTDPGDARIFIDGREAGTGTFEEAFEVGQEVVVRAELDGYDTVEQTVSITEEIEPLSISMNRTIAGVRIETIPDDAVVTINGENRGQGSVTAEFPLGEEVAVSVSREGYESVERTVEVEGTAEAVRFELERLIGTVTVSAQPADAAILIDGRRVGTGSVSREYPVGTDLTLQIQRSTYAPLEIPVTVEEGINEFEYQLSRTIGSLAVTVVPNSARISINGRAAGTGSVTQEFAIGETVQVSASRPGFAPVRRSVQVSDSRAAVELRLQPRPIEATISAASSPWIRGLVTDGTRVFGADGRGTVYAVDPGGRLLWQRATENSGNENSQPVVSGGRVAFSGAAELVVLSATTGQVQGQRALSGAESHLFGRRVAPRRGGWFFPSDDAVLVLSADGRNEERRFSVPGGSKMSVGVASNRILIADQQGGVVILDASTGNVITTVSTGMTQPVALAPAISGNTAVFVGRRGTVTAISVSGGSVLWESSLPGGRGSFVDPVVVGQRVLFLDRSDLVALSLGDGSRSYTLSGVAGVPAVDGTTIYVPYADGTIRAHDGSTGRTLRELSLPAAAAGGAVMVGERVATGLEDGRVVIIHPAGM